VSALLLTSLYASGSFIPIYETCTNRRELSAHVSIGLIYLSTYRSIALQPFVGPWPLFSFLIFYAVL
jgi:hypothetical protein